MLVLRIVVIKQGLISHCRCLSSSTRSPYSREIMGKNWKGHKSRGDWKSFTNDLASCRGHAVVVATCDNLRGREASKELINLLNEAIDILYPDQSPHDVDVEGDGNISQSNKSIKDLLDEEIRQANQSRTASTSSQKVVSIQTDVNCVILAKIMSRDVCPVKLVEEIFNRLEREKKPLCKNIIRIIPLKDVFFPRNDELLEHLYRYMLKEFPGITLPAAKEEIDRLQQANSSSKLSASPACADDNTIEESIGSTAADEPSKKRPRTSLEYDDDDEAILRSEQLLTIRPSHQAVAIETSDVSLSSASYPPITCEILFKARNHNILTKTSVLEIVSQCKPTFMQLTFVKPQVSAT